MEQSPAPGPLRSGGHGLSGPAEGVELIRLGRFLGPNPEVVHADSLEDRPDPLIDQLQVRPARRGSRRSRRPPPAGPRSIHGEMTALDPTPAEPEGLAHLLHALLEVGHHDADVERGFHQCHGLLLRSDAGAGSQPGGAGARHGAARA